MVARIRTSIHIHLKFLLADRSSQPWVKLSGIFIIRIVFGVVNVFFWTVDTKTFLGDFEFGLIKMVSKEFLLIYCIVISYSCITCCMLALISSP